MVEPAGMVSNQVTRVTLAALPFGPTWIQRWPSPNGLSAEEYQGIVQPKRSR